MRGRCREGSNAVGGNACTTRLSLPDESFVNVMRWYFMINVRQSGYETIEVQTVFIAHYQRHHQRFEWPQDGHWHVLGPERCFDAVVRSEPLSGKFPRQK